jgi:hypothetical protein
MAVAALVHVGSSTLGFCIFFLDLVFLTEVFLGFLFGGMFSFFSLDLRKSAHPWIDVQNMCEMGQSFSRVPGVC